MIERSCSDTQLRQSVPFFRIQNHQGLRARERKVDGGWWGFVQGRQLAGLGAVELRQLEH